MITPDPVTGLVQHPQPVPYPFGPTDVASVLNVGLEHHPERVALEDGDRTWTWSELDAAVTAMAGGIAPNEAILWQLPNCAELVIGSLATFRAGGVWLGSADDLAEQTQLRVEQHLGPLRRVRTLEDLPSGNRHAPTIDPQALAAVTFTSGTSGTPKAVAHSQRNLLLPGLLSVDGEPPTPSERLGTPLRLTILNLLLLGPISAFLRGSTFVVMKRTFAAGLAEDIAAAKVTRLFAVPTLVFDLAESAEVHSGQLVTLDRVILGGSGADPKAIWDFFDRFEVRPTLSYGLSEAPTGVVRESLDDPIGSGRGFPMPHVDVQIVDGEVCLTPSSEGPWAGTWTPTLGYLGEPERTAALFSDGLVHTGDLGLLDDDGALHVTGRMSDLIVRGGKNIDPVEIERLLNTSPGIAEALAVGVPSERLGQEVGVLLVPDHDADGIDVVEGVMQAEENASAFFPIDHVAVVESLPRNAMGKVVRVAPPGLFD